MHLRSAFVAAPVLLFAYGVIRILDGLDGSRGPGPAWTVGHLAFLGALAAFVPVFSHLRALIGGRLAGATAAVGYAGMAALAVQFAIDLAVGFAAADKAEMSTLFDRVQSVPGIIPVVYVIGPNLFFVALLALAVELAVARRVKAWVPVLVLADVTLPLVDKDFIPVGAILLLIAFLPLIRRPTPPTPLPA